MKNIHTQESGRSMIEMLGVLAIIGVLSVGGIAGYSQAMNKFKVTKTTDQIQTMVQNIRTLFATQSTYNGVSTYSTMYNTGVLTDENCPSGGASCATPVNPYGGTIVLKSIKHNGIDHKGFSIAYQGLPQDACVRLSMQSWGDASSGLTAVGAYKATTTPADTTPTAAADADGGVLHITQTANTVPLSLASANQGCSGGDGASSTLVLYFK